MSNITFTGKLNDGREITIEIIQQRPDPSVGVFSRVEMLVATDDAENEIVLSEKEETRLYAEAEKVVDEYSPGMFDI